MATGDSTELEHSPHHLKAKGSNPTVVAEKEREMGKFFFIYKNLTRAKSGVSFHLDQLISSDFRAVNVSDGVEQIVRFVDDHHRILQLDADRLASLLVKQRIVRHDYDLVAML